MTPTPATTTPNGNLDYGALAKRAWGAFTRKPVELILGMLIASLTGILVVTVGAAVLGMSQQALEAVRGRDVTIGSALGGYQRFGASLAALVLLALIVGGGLLLLVLPGIAAIFFLNWTFLCMADDSSLGAVAALKRSFALAKAHPVPTLAALAAEFLLGLAGGVVKIGFLVTAPLGLLFAAAVYDAVQTSAKKVLPG